MQLTLRDVTRINGNYTDEVRFSHDVTVTGSATAMQHLSPTPVGGTSTVPAGTKIHRTAVLGSKALGDNPFTVTTTSATPISTFSLTYTNGQSSYQYIGISDFLVCT